MKITKPNITGGKWYVAIESVSFTTIRSSNQKNHYRDYLCRVDDGLGMQLKERQSNAKAISTVPDMIDALIDDIEVLELCAELMAQKDMSYEFINMRIDKSKKALTKAGCTYEH